MATKLSPAQRAVLENLKAGRSPTTHLRSMSEMGGYNSTRVSLARKGYTDEGGFITGTGLKALEQTA